MKILGDTQIVRYGSSPTEEWELPVAYRVEELYRGTDDPDDPSSCVISEHVRVLEAVGPFRVGDLLVLTDDEKEELEQEELQAAYG